ncbi:MAG: CYTH domain-containing protein [Clostridia bacterium]|nr:CYTH domain-containing protein [Clostridia bacterium]
MKTEYEIRVLDINKEEMIEMLEKIGAIRVGEYYQKRYIYDLKPAEDNKWIRLRTDGYKTTLTYKCIEENTIDGTKEIELEVSSIDQAKEFMNSIGFKYRNYQENKRTKYIYDGIEIDFDLWPKIPEYMEIEGESEEQVNSMIEKLHIDKSKVTALNCDDIYRQIYNIDIKTIRELKF